MRRLPRPPVPPPPREGLPVMDPQQRPHRGPASACCHGSSRSTRRRPPQLPRILLHPFILDLRVPHPAAPEAGRAANKPALQEEVRGHGEVELHNVAAAAEYGVPSPKLATSRNPRRPGAGRSSLCVCGKARCHEAPGDLGSAVGAWLEQAEARRQEKLTREFADPVVAERTLEFLIANKMKILISFPALIPQFYPLLLKLIASNGERLDQKFSEVLPLMMSPGSFLPLFLSLMDLPMLVVALEKVERSSGTLIGSSIATIQKSAAPEMLLALMDEAYTGSAVEDPSGNSGSDDTGPLDLADPMFLDLLKDENDGIAAKHWISPMISSTLQAAINSPQSDRLKQSLIMAPRFLTLYFATALRDVNDSLLCALIPVVMSRYAAMFPDKVFSFEVRKRLSDFILAAFQRYPDIIAVLKKPITDRLGEAHDNPAKTELALHLCWAIGEHGAGGINRKDVARELFENLELLLYENLATSRLALSQEPGFDSMGASSRKSSQARLLCFVVTAIAKLATCHSELLPRARVSLAKVARSRTSDRRVWQRACDYLGLMNEPAICLSVLGPSTAQGNGPGIVNWSEGSTKMVAHIPFYLLAEQKGPPFHDFSFADLLPTDERNTAS